MLIKWLFIYINPAGQIKVFKEINELKQKVVDYCVGKEVNQLDKRKTIDTLVFIFHHLKLLNNDQELIQGQLNLAMIINNLPEDEFEN